MEALIQSHKFVRNHIRINVATDDEIVYYNKKPYLKKGIYSNTLRTGDLFSLVKSIHPNVNEICLNRDVQCRPHKDKTNVTESHIIFFEILPVALYASKTARASMKKTNGTNSTANKPIGTSLTLEQNIL